MQEQEERESCNTAGGAGEPDPRLPPGDPPGPAHLTLRILIWKVDIHFLPHAISIGDIQLVPPGGPGLLGGCRGRGVAVS